MAKRPVTVQLQGKQAEKPGNFIHGKNNEYKEMMCYKTLLNVMYIENGVWQDENIKSRLLSGFSILEEWAS
jgi:hypothetical protein